MSRRDQLAGPGMGYGTSAPRGRGGVPLSTVVLALLCVVLAVALGLALAGRQAGTAETSAPAAPVTVTVTPTGSVSPTPGGSSPTAGEPSGARDTVATFLRAWREKNPTVRKPLLQRVATAQLATQLSGPKGKTVQATPVGGPVITLTGDFTATARQRLSDKHTVTLQLVFDATAPYGWVVDAATRTV